jgi:6-phosphofructokinase 1
MQCASQVDVEEAYHVGQVALEKAVEGESDKMVTLIRKQSDPYSSDTGLIDLEKVALRTRSVPDEFINNDSNFVTEKFIDYATPLIGGPLPEYARLRKIKLERKLPPYT